MDEQSTGAEATNSEEVVEILPESIDDPMVLKAELAKKDKAIRQIHARAIKAETLLKERSQTSDSAEAPITNSVPKAQFDEALELRFDGYKPKEVEFILQNGGRKALEDGSSLVSLAIKTAREQAAAEQAANQTNQSGGEDQLREVNYNLPKNPSLQDLKKSIGVLEQNLPHAD